MWGFGPRSCRRLAVRGSVGMQRAAEKGHSPPLRGRSPNTPFARPLGLVPADVRQGAAKGPGGAALPPGRRPGGHITRRSLPRGGGAAARARGGGAWAGRPRARERTGRGRRLRAVSARPRGARRRASRKGPRARGSRLRRRSHLGAEVNALPSPPFAAVGSEEAGALSSQRPPPPPPRSGAGDMERKSRLWPRRRLRAHRRYWRKVARDTGSGPRGRAPRPSYPVPSGPRAAPEPGPPRRGMEAGPGRRPRVGAPGPGVGPAARGGRGAGRVRTDGAAAPGLGTCSVSPRSSTPFFIYMK